MYLLLFSVHLTLYCVSSSFRAVPTRRTAPSCKNQTAPHLQPTEENNHFLPFGLFFFYMWSYFFVFRLICRLELLRGFWGKGHRIFIFCFFFLYVIACVLCYANACPALLAHSLSLSVTHTKSSLTRACASIRVGVSRLMSVNTGCQHSTRTAGEPCQESVYSRTDSLLIMFITCQIDQIFT